MGRTRKRFNEKARQNKEQPVIIEDKNKVIVDIGVQEEKYDSSNPLVICGKKRKTSSLHKKNVPEKKPLSKKQKKKLKGILEKKKKKLNRAELLEKLTMIQAKPHELECLTSTSDMQTCGRKKFLQEKGDSSAKCLRIINEAGYDDCPAKKKRKLNNYMQRIAEFECSFNNNDLEQDSTSESDVESINSSKDCTEETNIASSTHDISIVSCAEETNVASSTCEISTASCTEEANAVSCIKETNNTELKLDCDNNENNLPATGTVEHIPTVFVPVNRKPEIQAAREALPIFSEEQAIMEAVRENSVVVIHGETGSGKTTQLPQFLYEAGYALNKKNIGITEPRRIAAMSMAARVATEMNMPDIVAFHVRYDNNVTDETLIKFMTDGVLLKEMRRDFFLEAYSVIIIDEAHERSIFSDILIGLLSRVISIRKERGNPLKLIIMSATMRIDDFLNNPRLFKEPPFLIRIQSRQYKVQVHFNIHTPSDYLEACYHKVCKIHSQLPNGAILVFLTGENEVNQLCKRLRDTFPFKKTSNGNSNCESENLKAENTSDLNESNKIIDEKKESKDTSICALPDINLDNYSVEPNDNIDSDIQLETSENTSNAPISTIKENTMPLYTLPLYSILPFAEQEKVFQPPPSGTRLCVVSTNVAETSITIPGLKYVVDSGKVKTRVYDKFGGVSQFCITWTSKASSNQRAGRAGRTEKGHCYRLYSSAVFEHDFLDFTPPEIQCTPIDDVVLQMKALGIDRVVNFPFPSPPDSESLKAAEQRLVHLGALKDLKKGDRYKDIKKWEYSAQITELGKLMSRFPLSPCYSKVLVLSHKYTECVPYVIAIVSAMTVPEVFVNHPTGDEDSEEKEIKEISVGRDSEEKEIKEISVGRDSEEKEIKKITVGRGKQLQLGDAMLLLKAVALYEESKNKMKFCFKNGVRHKSMVEIHKMRVQLTREVNGVFKKYLSLPLEMNLQPPNDEQLEKLRELLASGFTDHVARLLPEEEMNLNKAFKNGYKCLDLEEPVFIHPSSTLFKELPTFVIYREIIHTSKYYMKVITEINPEWLPTFAPTLCKFSEPLETPEPNYDYENDQILCTMNVKYGPLQWEIPNVRKEMPKGLLRYSWFAYFLLEGQIHKLFKGFRTDLLSSPSTLLKTWAKNLPRTRNLLHALIEKDIDSRKSLMKIWGNTESSECKEYLLKEYCEWLPKSKHLDISYQWPPK